MTEAKAIATLDNKMQGQDVGSFMETVLARLNMAKLETPVQMTTSINALVIKRMMKEII